MVLNFLHSGKMGDLIFSLPLIKQLGGGNLYLKLNEWDAGANFGAGEFKLTDQTYKLMLSLLESQPYIKQVAIFNNDPIHYDLNWFRESVDSSYTLAQSYFVALGFNDYSAIRSSWLTVEPNTAFNDKIVISRTNRYLVGRPEINGFYTHLKSRNLSKQGVYLGTDEEYENFERLYDTGIKHHKIQSLLEAASIIAACKYYTGNENVFNAIAEGLKKITFLECNNNNYCIYERPDQFLI